MLISCSKAVVIYLPLGDRILKTYYLPIPEIESDHVLASRCTDESLFALLLAPRAGCANRGGKPLPKLVL
ncbi:hypothetical protein NDI37_18845 [Funiculus sociatus GB2-A5]|uniref:Uncharacterized protein n=1 Tax=Funiculus sociatus GB2-A5 TaxID=2933946 RepID=A0ABV0JST2_9CYAN